MIGKDTDICLFTNHFARRLKKIMLINLNGKLNSFFESSIHGSGFKTFRNVIFEPKFFNQQKSWKEK